MKKVIVLLGVAMLLMSSCVKFPHPTDKVDPNGLKIAENFDWKTIEAQTVSSSGVFSVINQDGDTVALNLPAGEYNLYVGKGSVLTTVASNANLDISTKAISSPSTGTKTRVYFPCENKYATVMFEDLFPYSGDKDMNDVVFGLNIEYDLDKNARVVAINFNIEPRAVGSTQTYIGIGANFTGMAVQVSKVARSSTDYPGISNDHSDLAPIYNVDPKTGYYNPVNPSDQLNADYKVAPFTGNFRSFFNSPPSDTPFINVFDIGPATTSKKFTAKVSLNSVIAYSSFTFLDVYNTNKVNVSIYATFENKSREVHFKGQLPSKYFNLATFEPTGKTDFSSAYDSWVWAIMSDKSVRHPLETVRIYNAYPDFGLWVSTQNKTNWYGTKVLDSLFTKINFAYD
jgi:LruC domain-containing protein